MSKKQYKIDGADVENYFDTLKSKEKNALFDIVTTSQNIHLPSLYELNKLLKSEVSIDQIKTNEELISLLERDVNLQSASRGYSLEEMAEKEYSLGAISVISAKIHTKIKKDEFKSTTKLKEFLNEELSAYQKKQEDQSDKDLIRMTLVYKDDKGEKFITKEQLLSDKSLHLSDSQRNVVRNYWNQSNATGWLTWPKLIKEKEKKILSNMELLIDASKGKCNLYNAQSWEMLDMEDPEKEFDLLLQGVLRLDISNLSEKTQLPGISQVKPRVEFHISELGSNEISLDIPESIKSESNHNPYHEIYQSSARALLNHVSTYNTGQITKDAGIIMNSLTKAYGITRYLNLIADLSQENTPDKNVKRFISDEINKALKALEENANALEKNALENELKKNASEKDALEREKKELIKPECLGEVMQAYCKITDNSKEKNNFAIKLINLALKSEESKVLDTKQVHNLAKHVENIVTPICKNETEKLALKKNSRKLVRRTSQLFPGSLSFKLSFKEKWKFYKNKIVDFIGYFLNRKSEKSLSKPVFDKIVKKLQNNRSPKKTTSVTVKPKTTSKQKSGGIGR